MKHVIGALALSAVLLSMDVVLAAEPPPTGGLSSRANAPAATQKTRKPAKTAKVMTPKPKVAKAKAPKPARAPNKAEKNVGPTTPSAPSATLTPAAAESTQK